MKRFIFGLSVGIAIGFMATISAQEKIIPTSPQTFSAPPTIDGFEPVSLCITRQVANYSAHPSIVISLAPQNTNAAVPGALQVFTYPDASVPALDTDAEVTTLIGNFKTANLSTAYAGNASTGNLWQRVQHFLCRDFPSRFPGGGCTVQ